MTPDKKLLSEYLAQSTRRLAKRHANSLNAIMRIEFLTILFCTHFFRFCFALYVYSIALRPDADFLSRQLFECETFAKNVVLPNANIHLLSH